MLGGRDGAGCVAVEVELAGRLVDADVALVGVPGAPGDGAALGHAGERQRADGPVGGHVVRGELEGVVGERGLGAVVGGEGHGVEVVGEGVPGSLVALVGAEDEAASGVAAPARAEGAAVGVQQLDEARRLGVLGRDGEGVDERARREARLIGQVILPVGVDQAPGGVRGEERGAHLGAAGGAPAVGDHAAGERACKAGDVVARDARAAIDDGTGNRDAKGALGQLVAALVDHLAGDVQVLHHAGGADAGKELGARARVLEGDGVALTVERAVQGDEAAHEEAEVATVDDDVVIEHVVGIGARGELVLQVALGGEVDDALGLLHRGRGLLFDERRLRGGERLGRCVHVVLRGAGILQHRLGVRERVGEGAPTGGLVIGLVQRGRRGNGRLEGVFVDDDGRGAARELRIVARERPGEAGLGSVGVQDVRGCGGLELAGGEPLVVLLHKRAVSHGDLAVAHGEDVVLHGSGRAFAHDAAAHHGGDRAGKVRVAHGAALELAHQAADLA